MALGCEVCVEYYSLVAQPVVSLADLPSGVVSVVRAGSGREVLLLVVCGCENASVAVSDALIAGDFAAARQWRRQRGRKELRRRDVPCQPHPVASALLRRRAMG